MAEPDRRPLSRFRLPGQLVYLYLAAPIIATPVLSPRFLTFTPRRFLLETAANYVPFLGIPAGLHALYRFVMPALAPRVRRFWTKLLVHASASALVTVAIAIAVYPLCQLLTGSRGPLLGFALKCVVVSWTFLLPISLVQELRSRTEAAEAAERTALRAQIEAIQSRTNPHFLFNALNTIASLIRDDAAMAERTLERLADILRYSLQNAPAETVSLGRELEMVRDYLEIQRARFGDKLRYTIDVEDGLQTLALPPFVLQPLVENAIVHGVAGRISGGEVRLSARRRAGQAEFRVDDDGPGPEGSAHHGNGTGLRDLQRRLQLLYGDAYSLVTRANEVGGFSVQLVVPTEDATA